jgi:hypothetical protein
MSVGLVGIVRSSILPFGSWRWCKYVVFIGVGVVAFTDRIDRVFGVYIFTTE